MEITELNYDRKSLASILQGVGVEVGVANAHFSKVILDNPRVKKLYGVDAYEPHERYSDYKLKETFTRMHTNAIKRTREYSNFELIRKFSMDAVGDFTGESLDFVYIDADHSYQTTLQDIQEWSKKVVKGGVICGDDYVQQDPIDPRYDVYHAVNAYVRAHPKIEELFIYAGGISPNNWMFIKS